MDNDEQRKELAEKLGEIQDEIEDGVLLGFVCIAEWVKPDGTRWLTIYSGNSMGDSIPKWQTRGYLHEGLFNWATNDEEEEQDDD